MGVTPAGGGSSGVSGLTSLRKPARRGRPALQSLLEETKKLGQPYQKVWRGGPGHHKALGTPLKPSLFEGSGPSQKARKTAFLGVFPGGLGGSKKAKNW